MLIEIFVLSSLAFGIKNYKLNQQKTASNKKQPLKPKSSNLYQKIKTSLQAVKKVSMISLTGGEVRHQQLKQMVTVEGDNQANVYDDKKLNKNIFRSIGLMGLGLIGTWFYSPLRLIAVTGGIYLFSSFSKVFFGIEERACKHMHS